ncbi:MAG: 23S rRNA (adenine(2030)-N(6))-methyltransferase RlmJ [Burkholderiales bacterium]
MLAYRHLFHAGNFADVFKHAMLARLLVGLARKDTPFCYVDTHSGIGRYDLSHPWAHKNAEFREGIERVWMRTDAPEPFAPYLDRVRAFNPDGHLRFYPGSPCLARALLRPGDRMVLSELNKEDCARLHSLFEHDGTVTVRCMDGLQSLKAHLPPKERRGLVLVDSSFDRAGEYARLVEALVDAHRRFATGVYAIWYPLMAPAATRAFERRVFATGIRKVLRAELSVRPERWTGSLRGSAMLIVNPPFGLEREAHEMLAWLWPVLAKEGQGGQSVRWLVPE